MMNEFQEWCESIRRQSIAETNVPFIMVIQNGTASATKMTGVSMDAVNNKIELLGLETDLLINKTKIHGDNK